MAISALVIDFSRVLLFARTDVPSLNRHHEKLSEQPGYRVEEHFYLNNELITYLRTFAQRLPIFLFTDGHLHKLPEFAPALQGIFTSVISPEEIGYKKSQSEAYLTLAYKIGHDPHNLLFIDDSSTNVSAATAAGLVAIRYESNAQITSILDRWQ